MSEKIFDYMTIPEEYSPDVFGKGCMILRFKYASPTDSLLTLSRERFNLDSIAGHGD